jgi:hypothetical protein
LPENIPMKNSILLVFAITLVSVTVSAQVTFGPTIGVYNSRFSDHVYKFNVYREGQVAAIDMRVGVGANMPMSSKWSMQTGMLYTTNTYRFQDRRYKNMISRLRINALEVPVVAHHIARQKNGSQFFLGAGPYFAVNISAKADVVTTDMVGNYLGNLQYKVEIGKPGSTVRRLGAGAVVNAGYQMKGGLSLALQFQQRLTNQYNKKTVYHLLNRNYGITFTYLFRLKKEKKSEASN